MTINLDVFGALMKNGIATNVNSRLIVTKESDRLERSEAQLLEQTNQPSDLRGSL